MFPAVQSPEVAEKHQHDRPVTPRVTEAVHGTVRVRKLQVGEGIEIHGLKSRTMEPHTLAGGTASKTHVRTGRAGPGQVCGKEILYRPC
jgi:hypothetical protein